MTKSILLAGLLLAGCNNTSYMKQLPPPPTNTTVVTRDVPVPVLCKVEVKRPMTSIDGAQQGLKLEEQNKTLRKTVGEQKVYIKTLESNVIGCGGKITNR